MHPQGCKFHPQETQEEKEIQKDERTLYDWLNPNKKNDASSKKHSGNQDSSILEAYKNGTLDKRLREQSRL